MSAADVKFARVNKRIDDTIHGNMMNPQLQQRDFHQLYGFQDTQSKPHCWPEAQTILLLG